MKPETIHIVAGPTASGKSAYAVALANKINGVIVNADSMQVYDGLAILTAQPSEEDKKTVPHRLYGALHPNDSCSAGNWREMAQPVIEDILRDGKTPVVVGGTGLYIKALTEGLSPMPHVPQDIRRAAVQRQKELGNPQFYEELKKRDPVMAARFHPFHTARLVRAWEVLEATGKSLSEWQKLDRLAPPAHWRFEIHKIMPEREELYRRCNERFLGMLEAGVLDEVRDFAEKTANGTIRKDIPLAKALGLSPLLDHLQSKITLDEAIVLSQNETRQYAKRQITWFRHQL